jgi:hypothetical protein
MVEPARDHAALMQDYAAALELVEELKRQKVRPDVPRWARPTWTAMPPTRPGWYWMRTASDRTRQVVEVEFNDGEAVVLNTGIDLRTEIDLLDKPEWAGPLIPPE